MTEHNFTPAEVKAELQCAIEWLEQHGSNTNAAGIIAICNHAIDTIDRQREILTEIREAYEKYGGAYGMNLKIEELEKRCGVEKI
jgi:hypothetical protein